MIEPDNTIRFEKEDMPDLPEVKKPRKKRKKHEEPEPTDWRPFGIEW